MKKSYKNLLTVGIAIGLSASFTLLSFAGWEQTGTTWKYKDNSQGIYLTGWQWLDGNQDNVAECYYLDNTGVMVSNTSVDGWVLNDLGQWTVNGIVQTQPTQDTAHTQSTQAPSNGVEMPQGNLTPEEQAEWDEYNKLRAELDANPAEGNDVDPNFKAPDLTPEERAKQEEWSNNLNMGGM